ncbi:MAG TPA: AI-2E family transporter [Chloroflexia bacterium]|nr:AI-2E family transporter [Chloroflexia bacterium]
MRQKRKLADAAHPVGGHPSPTPIRIPKRTRTVLVVLGGILLALLMWFAPTVPVVLLGGFALAMALSFPVRWLSYLMPRGLAILATFLLLIGAGALALLFVVPILIAQLASLVKAAPDIAREANATARSLLEPLSQLGLLPGTPDQFMSKLGQDVVNLTQELARKTLGGLVRFVSGAIGVALSLFGVLFVAVYLLANVRRLKATFLVRSPTRYRRDARQLWGAFAFTFSRYLSGLGLDMFIQGAISAIGLYFLGVPYALLLGTWVSLTAVIPYLGAWLGAIPAVIVAFTVSPATALLTALFYLIIQQLEGNVLQPRIQGSALHVPSILIFLAVIAGGEMVGLLGVIFAVPALAALKVLFDFFRARLETED